jgi:hypothetical protein
VEGTNQTVLGSSDQEKVPASLSLFLKSETIPALLCVGKGPEYRPFPDFLTCSIGFRGTNAVNVCDVSGPFVPKTKIHL